MKYGIVISDKSANQEKINLTAFSNEMDDLDIVPVFVNTLCNTICWEDKEGRHTLTMNKEQLEKERERNIPLGEHVGLMELLAKCIPLGSVVMFKDNLTISKYPDLFFHIYQQFRKRKISIQFIDTYWLSSDPLRCVGLTDPSVEMQLILNLVNLTYQNYCDENTLRYNDLPTDSGELKKNKQGSNPYWAAVQILDQPN